MASLFVFISRHGQAVLLSRNHWGELSIVDAPARTRRHLWSGANSGRVSVLSRTWRNRFDEAGRGFLTNGAHSLVWEVDREDFYTPEVRPLEEVEPALHETDDDSESQLRFTDAQISRTTHLARDHAFASFDSDRAQNATYEDSRFLGLQTFIGMAGCGTAQGATRFRYRRGKQYGPHGDTHLRTVKQFDPENLLSGFQEATERVLSVIRSEVTFRRPVTVAIDITTLRYYGDVKGMRMVSGAADGEEKIFKFATPSIVGQNIPIVLAVEPVRELAVGFEPAQPGSPSGATTHTAGADTRSDRDSAV